MATTTTSGHVSRALDFFERNDIFVGIGRTTPWEDEALPPVPSTEAKLVEEIMGYKKLEFIHLVVPDEAGEISYRDSRWRKVPFDKAVEENARWVYIEAHIRYDELPLQPYRQIGIFSRLKATTAASAKLVLTPEEVEDMGILEVLDNRRVVNRQLDQKEQLSMVIEF